MTGFSLVESVVVVSIISILTVMSFTAIPALRSHQELVGDTEKIRELIIDAKQRTLNQVRPEACLTSIGAASDSPEGAVCSDAGVAIQFGEIIEFANTYAPTANKYEYDQGGTLTRDYVISRSKPVTTITGGSGGTSLLFVSAPPSVELYNRGALLAGTASETITLTASNGSTRTLRIHPLGTIDIE